MGSAIRVGNDDQKTIATAAKVLGEEYRIIIRTPEDDPKLKECAAYCDHTVRTIVIGEFPPELMDVEGREENRKRILRHELLHAFMYESGLGTDCDWAHNEEMTDFFAMQFLKLMFCFHEARAI